MKCIWEQEDIVSGLLITNQRTKARNNRYMLVGGVRKSDGIRLVSLCDGMSMTGGITSERMAERLNNEDFAPSVNTDRELASVLGRGSILPPDQD